MARRRIIKKWKTPKMTVVSRSDDSETSLNSCKDEGCRYWGCLMYMVPSRGGDGSPSNAIGS